MVDLQDVSLRFERSRPFLDPRWLHFYIFVIINTNPARIKHEIC